MTATIQDICRDAARAANKGDRATAVALWSEAIDSGLAHGQPIPKATFLLLGKALFEAGRMADAEVRLRQGLARQASDFGLHFMLGHVLKAQRRNPEALASFAQAAAADPTNTAAQLECGYVHLNMAEGSKALPIFQKLARLAPKNGEYQWLLAWAYRMALDPEKALLHFKAARQLNGQDHRAWVDAAQLLREMGRYDEALELMERGRVSATHSEIFETAKVELLCASGRSDEAVSYLQQVLQRQPQAAWAHHQLGHAWILLDQEAANRHYREAVRLEPNNLGYVISLADGLQRTRGGNEGDNLEQAYQLVMQGLTLRGDVMRHAHEIIGILERCANYGVTDSIGDFDKLGRFWASKNMHETLLLQLPRVASAQQRRQLLEHHRLWGQSVEANAAGSPLTRGAPSSSAARRIRVGLMSSDLRGHPVSYFLLPLLEGYDKSRFEIYCYSWSSLPPDDVQQHIAGLVDVFRAVPGISARDAAQLMADDALDILFELGGSTHMNKLEAMAWRPAPIQISWMGYPHSAGLTSIDYIVVDPYLMPPDPALLMEKPLTLAHGWICMGHASAFGEHDAIVPGTPQQRSGRITFGTMNNPYKYRPPSLAVWAEVVRRTEGSRFLFVRPEGATPSFCENIWRAFEAGGVSRDRVEFIPARGSHKQYYNQIDIALDTFPQTGGTTTCESLWMGVPVVTLVGEALFERQSYSILMHAGLADCCAFSPEEYVAKALALARDPPRREALRSGLRAQIRSRPLGRCDLFVESFQRAVLHAVQSDKPVDERQAGSTLPMTQDIPL